MADNKRLSSTDAQAGSPPGPTLYIINLCASLAPVPTSGNTLPGLENYRLYQVARREDGRTRHRLRLGFFTSESHANSVLAVVRQKYPTAFAASLSSEDHRFTRGHLPAAMEEKAQHPAPAAPVVARPTPVAARNGTKPTPPRNGTLPAAQLPAPTSSRASRPADGPADVFEVTWEPDEAALAEASSAQLKALTEDACLDEFTWEGPALPAIQPATSPASPVTATSPPAAPAIPVLTLTDTASMRMPTLTPGDAPAFKSSSTSSAPTAAVSQPSPIANRANRGTPVSVRAAGPAKTRAQPTARPATPTGPRTPQDPPGTPNLDPALRGPAGLDSTQTLRALTSEELRDQAPEKWFAIQLVASGQPANLDTMPHLDIFEAYRLYSVALAAEGRITHSLRLGFFKEDVSAEAVCGYLKTFFPAPTVLRVSLAEQLRFKDAPQPRRPSAEDTRGNVIELNDARTGRPATPTLAEPAASPPQGAPTPTAAAATLRPPPTAKSPQPASRAVARNGAPVVKRQQATRTKPSSKYRTKNTLTGALMDETHTLDDADTRKPLQNNSLLSRLVDKLTK